jgi:hypothetical protein
MASRYFMRRSQSELRAQIAAVGFPTSSWPRRWPSSCQRVGALRGVVFQALGVGLTVKHDSFEPPWESSIKKLPCRRMRNWRVQGQQVHLRRKDDTRAGFSRFTEAELSKTTKVVK